VKALVTGGAGPSGATSSTGCWRGGHEVTAVDDLSEGDQRNEDDLLEVRI
jgi:nucleoside-diphosphate-sugar epimerase